MMSDHSNETPLYKIGNFEKGFIPREESNPLTLFEEIRQVLNKHCAENKSNTPDTVLASFLLECLTAFDGATIRRDFYYGKGMK